MPGFHAFLAWPLLSSGHSQQGPGTQRRTCALQFIRGSQILNPKHALCPVPLCPSPAAGQRYIPAMIRMFEDAGLLPVPFFINGVEAHTVVRDLLTSQFEQVRITPFNPFSPLPPPSQVPVRAGAHPWEGEALHPLPTSTPSGPRLGGRG